MLMLLVLLYSTSKAAVNKYSEVNIDKYYCLKYTVYTRVQAAVFFMGTKPILHIAVFISS